ncbi:hypothetical protein [Granulicella pectinivorans]|nr:hypothetical protein [Granulicella pectinivorans]
MMPEYLLAIELNDANSDDYKTLHQAMQAAGFHRFLATAEHRSWMVMPLAIYRGWSSKSVNDVLAVVKGAANSTVCLNKVYCAAVESSGSNFDEF